MFIGLPLLLVTLFDLRFGELLVFGVLLVDVCLLAYALVCCLLRLFGFDCVLIYVRLYNSRLCCGLVACWLFTGCWFLFGLPNFCV